MLEPVRKTAVRRIKPLLSVRSWQTLRHLDPSRRRREQSANWKGSAVQEDTLPSLDPTLPRPLRLLLTELDAILAEQPSAKVVVLVDNLPSTVLDLLSARHQHIGLTVIVETPERDPNRHARLAANGPYDLIVDAVWERSEPAKSYQEVLFHLRAGGRLVVRNLLPALPEPEGLWPLIGRLLVLRDEPGGIASSTRDERALARATSAVSVRGRHLVVTKATRSLAKVRDAEMNLVLAESEDRRGQLLRSIPAEAFQPRSRVREHAEDSWLREQPAIEVPELYLREYRNAICAPYQIVAQANLLLPDTYRHHLDPRLRNRMTVELSPHFAKPKADLSTAKPLPGRFYHLDSEFPDHFGHGMTEQIARLWGWDEAKARYPDLKILLGHRPGRNCLSTFEQGVLQGYGVDLADVVVFDQPVRVQTLVAVTPMFSMPIYVSTKIAPVWQRVGREAVRHAAGERYPARIFCARRRKARRCHNTATVEQMFRRTGFEIVYPEDRPFPDQVAMFRRAEVVAGYAGSALFTLCLVEDPKRVLMISPTSYRIATNEYLIAAVLGHEIDVFWSVPDEPRPPSGYTFDLAREGRHLQRCLSELG